jgi:23S rRNA (guanosine2251-2'-O)-methyltransferase
MAVLDHSPQRVLNLVVESSRKDDRIHKLKHSAQQLGLAIQSMDSRGFDKQLGEVNHQGVMALVKPAVPGNESQLFEQLDSLQKPALLLVLDGVQDPHNLGACLRTADAAGADAVIAPRDKACGLTATVSKVASGAAEVVPFYAVTNLARCLRDLQQQGIWCIGLAGEAERSFYEQKLTGPLALVMGAEGRGLRRLTRETCDELSHLPMLGSVSSLNVSVTAGVVLYEVVRQRQH